MSAAVTSAVSVNRVNGAFTPAFVPCTIVLSTTAYATASAGFAFDLAAILNSLPTLESAPNPNDVVGFIGYTADGYCAEQFVLGTPTWSAITGQTYGTGALATAPATMRLFNGVTELADGNISKTITGFMMMSRGGHA